MGSETSNTADTPPRAFTGDELHALLLEVQFVLLKHPVAAQAAIRALVAEGRRFATTTEGQRWKKRLMGSALVKRGQMIWDGTALDMFDPAEDAVMPSAYVDALAAAMASTDLQPLLARLAYGDVNDVRDE